MLAFCLVDGKQKVVPSLSGSMKVLLFKGKGLISRLIRWQTRSVYSHAAILYGSQVIEAHYRTGVRQVPYSAVWDHPHDSFMVKGLDSSAQRKVWEWLTTQLGKKYDLTMVLRFVSRRQETRKSKRKWFCSELVYAALDHEVRVFLRTEPWEVSPGMLCRSPILLDDINPMANL